jgi:hypothetical protein
MVGRLRHGDFSQGQGETIVLLPFGSLTVGYMKGLSQHLADAVLR